MYQAGDVTVEVCTLRHKMTDVSLLYPDRHLESAQVLRADRGRLACRLIAGEADATPRGMPSSSRTDRPVHPPMGRGSETRRAQLSARG